MNINFVCCTHYDSEDLIIVENFDSFQTKTKKLSLGSVGGLQNYVTDSGDKISTLDRQCEDLSFFLALRFL